MRAEDYRQRARENLSGNWPLSVAVAAVACLLGGMVVGSSFLPKISEDLKSILRLLSVALTVPGLVSFIIGGVLELGHAQFLLDQYDRRALRFSILFSKFGQFSTGFCQKFLRGLYTGLWGLLLVVPGIIASYGYALTPFLLAEYPDMTASQAIRASKALMMDHKWELFCLDVSFWGWFLLCCLTLNLGYLALNPYRCAARAAFYREITAGKHVADL